MQTRGGRESRRPREASLEHGDIRRKLTRELCQEGERAISITPAGLGISPKHLPFNYSLQKEALNVMREEAEEAGCLCFCVYA